VRRFLSAKRAADLVTTSRAIPALPVKGGKPGMRTLAMMADFVPISVPTLFAGLLENSPADGDEGSERDGSYARNDDESGGEDGHESTSPALTACSP
jgi:hypothetical protein